MPYKLTAKPFKTKNKEIVQQAICRLLSFITRFYPFSKLQPSMPRNILGLTFPNPVGVAAGFDKTGALLPCLNVVGFGFIEIGTINFDASTRNGNEEISSIQRNLKKAIKYKQNMLWGISLGSLRNEIDSQTLLDFISGMETFAQYADFLVINLSRPDTQIRNGNIDNDVLHRFFYQIKQHQLHISEHDNKRIPVLAKLAVEYQHEIAVENILLSLEQNNWDAVILAFENWPDLDHICVYLNHLKQQFKDMTFIVVGGIRSTEDCQLLLNAGASLLQIYTALVEKGSLKTRQMLSRLTDIY